jgi:hypothetical protein
MKYLIFNCAVFLALGYLIVGGDTKQIAEKVQIVRENITPQIEEVVEEVKQPVSHMIPEKVVKTEPVVEPAPEPVVEIAKASPAEPPDLPEAVEVAKIEPKKVPSRAGEVQSSNVQKIVQTEFKAQAIIEDTSVNTLEKTKERRQQLQKMVADMEQMFAEKMIR